MGMSHRKIKSVAKKVVPKGSLLSTVVLNTMKTVADIVGATLGPGGCAALIERQEYGFPNLVTKDGVTVFRSLGFADPVAHAIMETARDASVRTATEAGDGTTTATVLSEAIVRLTHEFCFQNPKVSPQRVVRTLEKIFRRDLEPLVKSWALKPDPKMLKAVATCSANGDVELATAIMECFELAGDDGNITIYEESGPSSYRVEALKGYPVGIGYEDSMQRFFPAFLNDRVSSRVYLENPVFALNFGTVTEIQQIFGIGGDMDDALSKYEAAKKAGESLPPKPPSNLVVVATGFSETVLANLAKNFNSPSINVVPLLVPKSPIQNGQMHFLEDLQAVTGATIFDPIRRPIHKGSLRDVGFPLEYFEMQRYRSNIVGIGDESHLKARVEELRAQLDKGAYESQQEKGLLLERLGKLTGGIAKLTVVGASNGEIREKKDRAEDASCAVRGAINHGALPGGCWAFAKLRLECLRKGTSSAAPSDEFEDQVIGAVLAPALEAPLHKLLSNCGFNEDEITETAGKLTESVDESEAVIYDALEQKFVEARDAGVMDSLPAVLEALRNSISIASLLGTLGGVVVFPRDNELERTEASETYDFLRDATGRQVQEE